MMNADLFAYGEVTLIVLSACCAGYAAYLQRARGFWQSAEAMFASLLLAVALLFPLPVAPVLIANGFVAYRFLTAVNGYKIDLTNTPVMPADLRTALRDPRLMFDITSTPHWLGWLMTIAALFVAAALATGIGFTVLQSDLLLTGARAVLLTGLVVYFVRVTRRFVDELNARFRDVACPFGDSLFDNALDSALRTPVSIWSPSFNSTLSRHLGIVPFLVFKLCRSDHFKPRIFSRTGHAAAVSPAAIAASLPLHERVDTPNVVVMQLESVCNPNWAFELGCEFQNFLFKRNNFTRFIAPLRVNVVGGGSWITEFEVLTGLDARVFGDDGLYTHVTLPSLIGEAFPAYLQRQGWRTFAFYPASGSFYNTRRAYRKYGFGTFWDAGDLSLPEWHSSDVMMRQAFGRKLGEMADAPFFAYVVTNGAHSPFRDVGGQDRASFSSRAGPSLARTMENYLALLRESEQAVHGVLDDLLEMEAKNGRPFVLLVFGDHQPWTFKRSGNGSFDNVRTAQPKNQTFAHLMSSKGSFELDTEIPVSLLPSILSCLVARDPADLYLPINFHLLNQCGPDSFGVPDRRSSAGAFDQAFGGEEAGSFISRAPAVGQVLEAQEAAIRWLQSSPVLRAP